jgi:undecaprenyl-diphosphatase
MSLIQTLLIAVIQGITELFPVSSVAHAVLTPFAFGWKLDPQFLKENFLPFVVMLHLGTAVALLGFFWRDWRDFLFSLADGGRSEARRTLMLVVVGTIPAAVIGFVFERQFKALFSSVTSAAFFLIVNGVVLYLGERLKGRGARPLAELGYAQAALIGLAQSFALVPGFSRSGASMVAGFWSGLTHEASARFSMLLATPIIAGASLLEIPKLARLTDPEGFGIATLGGAAAGLVAYLSVWALMRWFKRHEINAMWPFALNCWVVGGLALALG